MHSARCYPRGLGECLLRLHAEAKQRPRIDLRQKVRINPELTDLQIFNSLDDSDCWVDAQLPSVFLYLYKKAKIPDQWHDAMESYRMEMEKYVPRLHAQYKSIFELILSPLSPFPSLFTILRCLLKPTCRLQLVCRPSLRRQFQELPMEG